MSTTKIDLILHRVQRAKDTYLDAQILAENNRWNSVINRLYYAAYYIITALLLKFDYTPGTHSGVKALFSIHFIRTGVIPEEYGKLFSQLFSWRQKGDYDDLFDFDEERVSLYFEPVKKLIEAIETQFINE